MRVLCNQKKKYDLEYSRQTQDYNYLDECECHSCELQRLKARIEALEVKVKEEERKQDLVE